MANAIERLPPVRLNPHKISLLFALVSLVAMAKEKPKPGATLMDWAPQKFFDCQLHCFRNNNK